MQDNINLNKHEYVMCPHQPVNISHMLVRIIATENMQLLLPRSKRWHAIPCCCQNVGISSKSCDTSITNEANVTIGISFSPLLCLPQ